MVARGRRGSRARLTPIRCFLIGVLLIILFPPLITAVDGLPVGDG